MRELKEFIVYALLSVVVIMIFVFIRALSMNSWRWIEHGCVLVLTALLLDKVSKWIIKN